MLQECMQVGSDVDLYAGVLINKQGKQMTRNNGNTETETCSTTDKEQVKH